MKRYQSKMVDVIAEIHDLYDRTKDATIDKTDKEFIQNLAVTVEHYFKSKNQKQFRKEKSINNINDSKTWPYNPFKLSRY